MRKEIENRLITLSVGVNKLIMGMAKELIYQHLLMNATN